MNKNGITNDMIHKFSSFSQTAPADTSRHQTSDFKNKLEYRLSYLIILPSIDLKKVNENNLKN